MLEIERLVVGGKADTKGKKISQKRRSGNRKKRQRDAGDRHNSKIHTDINKGLHPYLEGQSEGKQKLGFVGGGIGPFDKSFDKKVIGSNDKNNCNKTKLFDGGGKDKVSVFFGEEEQLALSPLLVAFTKKTAGANSNFGLNDVVPLAEGVGIGVNKINYPLFLVVMKAKTPDERGKDRYNNGGEQAKFE